MVVSGNVRVDKQGDEVYMFVNGSYNGWCITALGAC